MQLRRWVGSAVCVAVVACTTGAEVQKGIDAFDTTCSKDQDCVPAPSCCPTPCTSEVINVRDLPRAEAKLSSCPKNEECPSAGACRTHAYLCVASHCALVFAGDPAYRAR